MNLLNNFHQYALLQSFLRYHHGPTVVLVELYEGESVGSKALLDNGDVVHIESAEENAAAGFHAGGVGIHVCGEYVAVDVGNDEVERWMFGTEHIGIT